MNTIKINKKNKLFEFGWLGLFTVICLVLLFIYFILLLKVNSIGSRITMLENEIRSMERNATEVQTKIYAMTKDLTFSQLVSSSEIALKEPKDLVIRYMKLPENTLVIR